MTGLQKESANRIGACMDMVSDGSPRGGGVGVGGGVVDGWTDNWNVPVLLSWYTVISWFLASICTLPSAITHVSKVWIMIESLDVIVIHTRHHPSNAAMT